MRLSPELLRKMVTEDPKHAAEIIRRYRKAAAVLARSDPNAFMEYVFRDDRTGKSVHQAPIHQALQEIATADRRACIWAAAESGKCELPAARILMADGRWRRIDSLSERCEIMALDPVRMELKRVWAGPSYNNGFKPVIKFHLAHHREITVTHEHPLYVKGRGWVQAKDIVPIPSGNPELLIASYTPMPWLGQRPGDLSVEEATLAGFLAGADQNFASGKFSVFWPEKKPLQDLLLATMAGRGWKVSAPLHGRVDIIAPDSEDRVGDIAATFRKGEEIADIVFQSSDLCVFAFLRALFSRAHAVGKYARHGKARQGHAASFTTESVAFARSIQMLATRLGGNLAVKQDKLGVSEQKLNAYGELVRTFERLTWRVGFVDEEQATLFWNMADLPPLGTFEKVVRVHRLEALDGTPFPRETWALPVHDDCHCYISGGVVSHNTTQLSVGHTLWKLGRDQNSSTIVISNTKDQAQKIIGQMKGLIQNSDRLHDVFPDLKPGNKWAEYSFTVARETERRDPSVQACGLRGNIQGARADNLLLDDIDDEESTISPTARADTLRWVQATAFSRLGEDAQVLAVGNTWDEDDCMHSLAKLPGWSSYKFSVLDDRGNPTWPERFSHERIQQIRQDLGDLQFARMYLCEPIDESTARFRPEWIGNALAAGTGLHMLNELADVPAGCTVITGVDLGVREKKGSDPTAMTTVLHYPNKKCEILNVEAGLWSAPEIADRIVSIHHRFNSTVFVENNAAQNFIVQIVQSLGERVPVKAFATGKNKHDPIYGVESLAVEMSTNQWVIPTLDGTRLGCHNEIRRLIEEMIVYAPNKHTGDRLMSLWIAREAGRVKGPSKAQVGKFRRF